MTPKLVIAKEWLTFVLCFILGFIVLIVLARTGKTKDLTDMEFFIVWFAPYAFVMFTRSLVWSVKTLKRGDNK